MDTNKDELKGAKKASPTEKDAGGSRGSAGEVTRASKITVALSWFTSKTVREATAMRKHVKKLLQHQRDILSPKAITEVETSMKSIDDAVATKADRATL